MKRLHRITGGTAVALFAVTAAAPAAAATCGVTTQEVAFGSYSPFSSTSLEGVGNINVTCDISATFTVSLSTGNSGTFDERRMTAGTAYLTYNVYSDAARTIIWGDGLTTSNVSATGTNVDLPVYGRIPARQNVVPNTYSDTITVTVTY